MEDWHGQLSYLSPEQQSCLPVWKSGKPSSAFVLSYLNLNYSRLAKSRFGSIFNRSSAMISRSNQVYLNLRQLTLNIH